MGRRIALALAWIASLPAGVLSIAALVYIVYSIGADEWYRHWFLGSGVSLAGMYALFVTGIVAAAMLVSGRADARGPRARRMALGFTAFGVLAAVGLEWQFFEDADDFPLRGFFLGPFVVWAIVAAMLRTRVARAA
jgi:hypothetical protein